MMVIILEDYADPFDAADQPGGTQSSVEKPVENDGYMEPYEAQKMMAEIRGSRGVKDGPARQLPLYDTPYEPAENGGDSDPLCSRESRLPQDDERPPEEYDQPWEWKKERISKAFAALLCYDCISSKEADRGSARRRVNTSKSLTGVKRPFEHVCSQMPPSKASSATTAIRRNVKTGRSVMWHQRPDTILHLGRVKRSAEGQLRGNTTLSGGT
ncbi:SH2 domain-containing adapter protein F-like isoform X2 [Clarias magur]|uniref:SH2 domain-containing adapter protein F-like isoform X2 n=1 Tax=Clarias magur TaxID=1594786 RepID=A0A8J4XAX3_CLAMG|nr:SH2 domain-containing adapter protein F-like isoform X2 [Clarias magur]